MDPRTVLAWSAALLLIFALLVTFAARRMRSIKVEAQRLADRNHASSLRSNEELRPTKTERRRTTDWRRFVLDYEFPKGMLDRAMKRCPPRTNREAMERGLRQFFLACGSVTTLNAAMPSKVVDEAWHEFITYTRDYAAFCDKAFGKFLHHVPESTMTTAELDANHGLGLVTAWQAACSEQGLNPLGGDVPALFSVDHAAKVVSALRYIGSCSGPYVDPESEPCKAKTGTVCMVHAHQDVWQPSRQIKPSEQKVLPTTRASDDRPASSTPVADPIAPVYFSDTTDSDHQHHDPSPSANPSCGSSVSSCGSSSSCGGSSTSTSSCGGSSSCGGGGCGGGS